MFKSDQIKELNGNNEDGLSEDSKLRKLQHRGLSSNSLNRFDNEGNFENNTPTLNQIHIGPGPGSTEMANFGTPAVNNSGTHATSSNASPI